MPMNATPVPAFGLLFVAGQLRYNLLSRHAEHAVPRIELRLQHQPAVSHFRTPFLFLYNHHLPSSLLSPSPCKSYFHKYIKTKIIK